METFPAAFLLDIPFISRNSYHDTRFNSASVKQTKSRGKKSQILKLLIPEGRLKPWWLTAAPPTTKYSTLWGLRIVHTLTRYCLISSLIIGLLFVSRLLNRVLLSLTRKDVHQSLCRGRTFFIWNSRH